MRIPPFRCGVGFVRASLCDVGGDQGQKLDVAGAETDCQPWDMDRSPAAPTPELRFYGELAPWWPLISPVEEYAEEAGEFARVLSEARVRVNSLLELGSGGGHNAYYMKRAHRMTLTDLSDGMLGLSRRLNPECEHVRGDMRTLDLGRSFDGVFIHDAVHYMLTREDLAAAIATAYRHCAPGGVALFVPDELRESYEPSTDCGGTDAADGRGVRYLAWSYDPDPDDDLSTTHYSFVMREASGQIYTHTETHLSGLFSRQTWLDLLEAQGFRPETVKEQTSEERPGREMFLAHRP